jgi:branched-chain amino acid transport system permease protein
VSFTHGSLLLLGAYTIARTSESIGFFPAVLVGVAVTALAAVLVERLIINRLRGAAVISLAIVTIGVDIILLTELIRRLGSDILNVPHPWGGGSFRIGDVGISQNRLIAMLVAAVLIALFFAAFKYSNWGIAMRASAEDGETAALMGIRQGQVSAPSRRRSSAGWTPPAARWWAGC